MRLVSRIPARKGRVLAIRVFLVYDGTDDSPGVDVTDVQLQPGDPSGVVPHPSDIVLRAGASTYRNGVITRSTDEVIILANTDLASPTSVQVKPSGAGEVSVGAFHFGSITGPAAVDGLHHVATNGYGRAPVLTARSDGRVAVEIEKPVHLTVGWTERF